MGDVARRRHHHAKAVLRADRQPEYEGPTTQAAVGIEPRDDLDWPAHRRSTRRHRRGFRCAVTDRGFASGRGVVAALARESQDLAVAWRDKDKAARNWAWESVA